MDLLNHFGQKVDREQISWVCPNGKSMKVLLLEVYIQKPTFKVFLMTQNLDGKSWLSERLLAVINSMMDTRISGR